MKIAITDANIFIDLIFIGLHDELFELDLEIHTTVEVYDELNQKQQSALAKSVKKNKLTLHVQDDLVSENIKSRKGLSESDKSVLHLAIKLNAFILTGDGLIRKISGFQKIEVHGIFWLLDKFLEHRLINKKVAYQQLKKLMEYNRRLPIQECNKRLDEWKS